MSVKVTAFNTPEKHPLFVVAVALGAFLIFLIQPLAARSLLPSFGGSGTVWVTALVFYQTILAAGYLFTHFVHTRLTMRRQKLTLILLATASVLTLSILPEPRIDSSGFPAMQLLLSLLTSVGFPFFVLAVAGPLIQGWAATNGGGASKSRDIYSLYAISNGASLLALAGYPLVVEPLLGVLQQGQVWEGLFVVQVLMLITITWRIKSIDPESEKLKITAKSAALPKRHTEHYRTLLWLCWSAAGVMILTSTSGYIGQEIAAVPMLWVVPLSLYLLTWIITFSGTVNPGSAARGFLALISLILIILAVDVRISMGIALKLGLALAGMTLACLAVHASLYKQRPDKGQLTHFYAAVSVGGAIGGIFAGVVAIQIFQDWRDLALAFGLVALLACGELLPRLRVQKIFKLQGEYTFWLGGLLLVGSCFLFVITGMQRPGLLYKHRDFHGLVRVVEMDQGDPQRHRLVMFHGATTHGCQMLNPNLGKTPTTYFGHGTGAEIAFNTQRTLVGRDRGLNVGVVGLGVGTMAAHLRSKDAMCFYELSPVVAELAQGKGLEDKSEHSFSYLSNSPGEVEVVIGDARLSMDSELTEHPEGNSYDLLVLDAFAGDSVPFHLLTREAFSLFTKHISEKGMMAVHVSSNWLDLVPVVYAWADAERWQALTISTKGTAGGPAGYNAVWVLLFQNQEALQVLANQCRPLMAEGNIIVQNLRNVNYGDLPPWTDNRSNLLALMRSKIQLRKDRPSRSREKIITKIYSQLQSEDGK